MSPWVYRMRVLTAADLHQSRLHYRGLTQAVKRHHPNVVAIVGDALEAFLFHKTFHFSTPECARRLAKLPVDHLIFVRGNHEDRNWPEFVAAWPHEHRKLIGLYGTAYQVGPLRIVGFPCQFGAEHHWCSTLQAGSNEMSLDLQADRDPLPPEPDCWLPDLLRRLGPGGRALWLMHEPPTDRTIARRETSNPLWLEAVHRFRPLVVVAGHDHAAPLANRTWYERVGESFCVNVGQAEGAFHFALMDFEFRQAGGHLPCMVTIRAFPWREVVVRK